MTESDNKLALLPMAMLALLALVVYGGASGSPLLAPEIRTLQSHPAIIDFSRVNEITQVDKIFNGSLPKLSLAVNYVLGHQQPLGYRLVNLFLHVLVAFALAWVVREWLSLLAPDKPHYRKWLPVTAAGLHLLHPLNSQAVLLIPSRSILMASLFYLLTFGFLSRFLRDYRKDPERAKGSLDFLMMMACLAVGGTCDPIMVTLPFMAWVLYRFYVRPEGGYELFGLALVPWVVYLIYQMSTPDLTLRAQAVGKTGGLTLLYFLSEIKAFLFYYLPKALVPMHLSLDPGMGLVSGWADWTWMLALAGLAALFFLVRASRSPLVLWAFLWTFLIFISFSGLGMDDPVVSEPRFYLPGIGVHLLLALGLVELGLRHPVAAWLRFGVPALFMILTFARLQDFRTEISIWEETARSSPHKPKVHYELARAYLSAGRTEEAEQQLTTTLGLDPKYRRALIDMGRIHLERNDYPKALNSFQALMDQGIREPALLLLAGETYLKMKQPDKAQPLLEKAVKKVPGHAEGHNLLARALHQSGQLHNAEREYRISLKIDPNQPVVHNELGLVYWDQKSYYFADSSFYKAYELDNRYTDALHNLVSSNMLFRDYPKAILFLNRLLEINPDDQNALQLLPAAQRLKKQFEENPPPPPKSPH